MAFAFALKEVENLASPSHNLPPCTFLQKSSFELSSKYQILFKGTCCFKSGENSLYGPK